jgi:hypothetical protein
VWFSLRDKVPQGEDGPAGGALAAQQRGAYSGGYFEEANANNLNLQVSLHRILGHVIPRCVHTSRYYVD